MIPMAYKRTPYLKTHEVAEALGISLGTVYNWLNAGKIAEPSEILLASIVNGLFTMSR